MLQHIPLPLHFPLTHNRYGHDRNDSCSFSRRDARCPPQTFARTPPSAGHHHVLKIILSSHHRYPHLQNASCCCGHLQVNGHHGQLCRSCKGEATELCKERCSRGASRLGHTILQHLGKRTSWLASLSAVIYSRHNSAYSQGRWGSDLTPEHKLRCTNE